MDPQTSIDRKTEAVAERLKVLAHPTRIQILVLLSQHHQLSVGDIQKKTTASRTRISLHLTKMGDKGLILRERRGKQVYVQLADPMLRDWLNVLFTLTDKLEKI